MAVIDSGVSDSKDFKTISGGYDYRLVAPVAINANASTAADIYGHGKPTRIANTDRDVRQGPGSLPVTESIPTTCYWMPWFKHYRPAIIEEYALAFRKVVERADDLM